jgi:4-amino-4-deoxy-L-arabinose transferase-like glycosyltransferase
LRLALPAAVVATAALAVVLLGRTPDYYSWLTPVIVGGAALGAGGLWLAWHFRSRALVLGAGALAAVALLAGPAAYSVSTIGNAATGAVVSAGPASGAGGFGGNGAGPGGSAGVDADLVSYLEANRGDAEYLVATFGSQSAAPLIIATGEPVIAIGGFTGSDPAPTLAEFQRMVADGEVRYVLIGGSGGGGGGGFGGPGGGGTGSDISSWVTSAGTAVDASAYGGSTAGTLYDLSSAA